MSEHTVSVTFDAGYIDYRMICHAPPEALCHAFYDCDCEAWGEQGVEGGKPWHETLTIFGDPERHVGEFLPRCAFKEWADAVGVPDMAGEGQVEFPVDITWHPDHESYLWSPTGSDLDTYVKVRIAAYLGDVGASLADTAAGIKAMDIDRGSESQGLDGACRVIDGRIQRLIKEIKEASS